MSSENQTKKDIQPNKQNPEKISFKWILLGVAAVLLMWMVSSWLFKG